MRTGVKHIAGVRDMYNDRLQNNTNPWRMRCFPYFYLLGVTKCGTTDFVKAFSRHEQIYWPWMTETMYWNIARYPEGVIVHQRKK